MTLVDRPGVFFNKM